MLNKFYQSYTGGQSLDFIIVLAAGFITYYITRLVLTNVVARIFRKTTTKLDDMMIEKGVLNKLSYLIPIVVVYNLIEIYNLNIQTNLTNNY